jgi:hypothetical protein
VDKAASHPDLGGYKARVDALKQLPPGPDTAAQVKALQDQLHNGDFAGMGNSARAYEAFDNALTDLAQKAVQP